jgi:hypothetical protein
MTYIILLGFVLWTFLEVAGSLFAVELSCCDCVEIKVNIEDMCLSHTGTYPMSHISVALRAQYLNVRQCKLGTIISF